MTDYRGEKDSGSPESGGDRLAARIAAESGAKEGKKVQHALDADQIRLFGLETKEAILQVG